jgi:hypothetical protein
VWSSAEQHLAKHASPPVNDKDKTFDEPSEVVVEDGEVVVHGPDNVDVKLTPEAAQETSDRLLEGAYKAVGERRLSDLPHQPVKD